MLLFVKNIINVIPVVKIEYYFFELVLFLKNNLFQKILKVLKNHFKYNFKVLTCISGLDFPENFNRFKLVYDILSIRYNNRVRLKIAVNEVTPVLSIEKIFIGSIWWELEAWDMFGIIFLKRKNLVRLLTDYGFKGFPLRKNFPLSGFVDSKFNIVKNRVCYENLELTQSYRIFSYKSPWQNFTKN